MKKHQTKCKNAQITIVFGKIAIEIPNFSVGVIKEVVVNNKVFYADYNASPIGMITKREGLW